MNSEFLGARASNAGDDYHEVWAARHAIELLSSDGDLQALTVEGVSSEEESTSSRGAWHGVDCALFYGGQDCRSAARVVIEQMKYSSASASRSWTVSRVTAGARREQSVIGRLASAWQAAKALAQPGTPIDVVLVSNQPIDSELVDCIGRLASRSHTVGTEELRLATAASLGDAQLSEFCSALRFEGGAASRFSAEERLIAAISEWAESDILHGVLKLREFVRNRMRPEHAGQVITRSAVLLQFGAYSAEVLLPSPPKLSRVDKPVRRRATELVVEGLRNGAQYIAVHGQGGVGKTTALQEVETELPVGSVMIVYDCYGGGTYLDPSALRHRPEDAYVQLINQTAIALGLPLILTRTTGDDLPRLFMRRLHHAAGALEAYAPGALLVVAIDAADNAIVAAEGRVPSDRAFVLDFVRIESLPANVRFIVSARTGRLDRLALPSRYQRVEVLPFDRRQTGEFVRRRAPAASDPWLDDFHHLSSGVPRVQSYALDGGAGDLDTALNRLRPTGKRLDDVFQSQLEVARRKSGDHTLRRLCGGLLALARPVPASALANILEASEAQVLDVCSDLSPGLRVDNRHLNFADEDFEDFMRRNAADALPAAADSAASWMLSRCGSDAYAAMHVAEALVAAGRGGDLLDVVEREAAPAAIPDPVLRREAEVQRLRLAIKVCRAAGDTSRALRFVLKGADGLKTEAALCELLTDHPDLAAAFAHETAGRLLLARPAEIERHGGFLFHRLAVDAHRGDAVAVREGNRRLRAWLDARSVAWRSNEHKFARPWRIGARQIASSIEATLLVRGADAALDQLDSWRPATVGLEVALILPSRLIAMGRSDLVRSVCASEHLGPIGRLLCSVPLALSGDPVATDVLVAGLSAFERRRPHVQRFFEGSHSDDSAHGKLLSIALTAAELLMSRGVACAAADRLMGAILEPKHRRIDKRHAFEAGKLDLLLRSFAVREIRAGRVPASKSFFEPRPDEKPGGRRAGKDHDAEHDRQMADLVGAVFELYAARASGLLGAKPAEVGAALGEAVSRLKGHEWRVSRHRDYAPLRAAAAASLLALLGTSMPTKALKRHVDDVHWPWISTGSTPSDDVVRTLMLRSELHSEVVSDLVHAAEAARAQRTSASEKCSNLAALARLLYPISPDDANAVFNQAVEGAAHIDREAMSQIQFLANLVRRGRGHFESTARVSGDLAAVVADACVRLQGYDGFPWDAAMSALASLDLPRALADASRWDDDGVATLSETLPEILQAGMEQGWLQPVHAAALACLVREDRLVLDAAIEHAVQSDSSAVSELVEMAASDSLVRHQHRDDAALRRLIGLTGPRGSWSSALVAQGAFLATLPADPARTDRSTQEGVEAPAVPVRNWMASDVVDADRLREAIFQAQGEARVAREYVSTRDLLREVREVVPVRNRVDHLDALVGLAAGEGKGEVPWAVIDALHAWRESPAVAQWSHANLPALLVKHMLDFVRLASRREESLSTVLSMTGQPQDRLGDLVLAGIELHVNQLSAQTIFQLVTLTTEMLSPAQSAALAGWYADRLSARVPVADKPVAPSDSAYPRDLDEAIAGVVFAYMGDCDLRMRWRAAHAVRRLSQLGCDGALRALVPMYAKVTGAAFRSEQLSFYWLAARLWYVLAWGRVASERPAVGAMAGEALLRIALDDSFPHMLIRASAHSACRALLEAGWRPSDAKAAEELDRVNEPRVARAKRKESPRRSVAKLAADARNSKRFSFNSLDTIPYWYEPLLRSFSDIDIQRFTREAERWIIDVWGYGKDLHRWDRETRRHQFERYSWALTSQSHGSLPTLERLSTHLEWHAMWCAAGELLKTEPLAANGTDGDDWYDLAQRVKRSLLSDPPTWSADLLSPTPLVPANWLPCGEAFDSWVQAVTENDHRSELLPADRPEYLVVEGAVERWSNDRIESIAVTSALAGQGASDSLVRALQTMESAWAYKLPDEGEDVEIDVGTFRMIGWLTRAEVDGGLDRKDEFRGAALVIGSRPGRLVRDACSLVRGGVGRDRWTSSSSESAAPMFLHEVWGREVNDGDRFSSVPVVWGHRLLAHREQLQRFLNATEMDLIVEVEVNRHGREYGQHAGEEEDAKEGKFDRVYRVCADGELTIAEGSLGPWHRHRV